MAESKQKRKCSFCGERGHNKTTCPKFRDQEFELRKLYIEKTGDIIASLTWEKLILSGLFTYAWWKAYGDEFKVSDIALGFAYGFSIPDALRGGIIANTYALGALAVLGVGFIPGDVIDDIISGVTETVPGAMKEAIAQATGAAPIPKRDISGRKPFQSP